jgi:hypothetical protein
MEPMIIDGDLKKHRSMKEELKELNTKKIPLWRHLINILLVSTIIGFSLFVLFQYNVIGNYSMRVLVKIPVEQVDLSTIAAAYMPELGREEAVQKIMYANRFQSSELVLLKGDVIRVPMYRKSRVPPEDLLLAIMKRIEANEEAFRNIKQKEL